VAPSPEPSFIPARPADLKAARRFRTAGRLSKLELQATSNQAMLGKGIAASVANDEVIEYPRVDERQRVPQPAGDVFIRLARLHDP